MGATQMFPNVAAPILRPGDAPTSRAERKQVTNNQRQMVPPDQTENSVLVFTKCTGYCHKNTKYAVEFISEELIAMGFLPVVSKNGSLLERDSKTTFKAIILYSNTGYLFDPVKEALSLHIAAGRGIMGVHSVPGAFLKDNKKTNRTQFLTNVMERIFGTQVSTHPPHPPCQTGNVSVDRAEAYLLGIDHLVPSEFQVRDEFFNYNINPRHIDGIHVVATVDESSYTGGTTLGDTHPVVWYRNLGNNDAPIFYCGLGHEKSAYNGKGPGYIRQIVKAGL